MRDRLFGATSSETHVRAKIRRCVGLRDDVTVRLMGELGTLELCVEKVSEDLSTDAQVSCLITGSLNYMPADRWSEANDIDVIVFRKGDRYTSTLEETENLDIVRVSVRDDLDVLTSLNVVYPVSRYFYNLRKFNDYSNIVDKITGLKKLCTQLCLKSSIVPAFKGFVIATVAVKTEGDLHACLRQLALLDSLQYDKDGNDVDITLYETNVDVSKMVQHRLVLPNDKTRRLGDASIRRGITTLLLNSTPPKTSQEINTLMSGWASEEFRFPDRFSTSGAKMSHILTTLNAFFSDIPVFVTLGENGTTFNVRSQNSASDTAQTPEPLPPPPTVETVSFWSVTTSEDTGQVSPSTSGGIAEYQRPDVRKIVTDDTGEEVSDEVDSFVRDMIGRHHDKLYPLISRHVDDVNIWTDRGLCLCHTNNTLPDSLTFLGTDKRVTLTKTNREAYRTHMSSWFAGTGYPEFEKGYTRFTNLIKLLDSVSKEPERMSAWYSIDGWRIDLRLDLNPIAPSPNEWPVKKFRAGWRQVREEMSKKESVEASSATESTVGADTSSPSGAKKSAPSATPSAPRKSATTRSRLRLW